MYTFKVIIVEDENGGYTATIPALEYCMSRGATIDDAINNVQEAMEGVIETMKSHNITIPSEKRVVEVSLQYPSLVSRVAHKKTTQSPSIIRSGRVSKPSHTS